MGSVSHLHGGVDPRDVPRYGVGEAAHYLRLPTTTLVNWVRGRTFPTKTGSSKVAPLIRVGQGGYLTFSNLVEAYVLASLRRRHEIPLQTVRKALGYLEREWKVTRPLIEEQFLTDGVHLFVEKLGKLFNVSLSGQAEMRDVLAKSVERVSRDAAGVIALFPWGRAPDEPRFVEVDPRRAFGKLVIVGTGIPTAAVRDRFQAGDDIEHLAADYGVAREMLEGAIRWELPAAA